MKKLVLACVLVATMVTTVGCSSVGNKIDKMTDGMNQSDYVVIQYSGGKSVGHWIIRNDFVNTEENSDGYFWSDKDSNTHRISGDVSVHEVEGLTDEEIKEKYSLN